LSVYNLYFSYILYVVFSCIVLPFWRNKVYITKQRWPRPYRMAANDTVPYAICLFILCCMQATYRVYAEKICHCITLCALLDEFVRSYLRTHHVDEPVWRTGGLRPSNNNTFYWYRRGSRGKHQPFKYGAWPVSRDPAASTNHVTTLVLRRQEMTGKQYAGIDFHFHWDMEIAGSAKRPQRYAYPYICETKAKSKTK